MKWLAGDRMFKKDYTEILPCSCTDLSHSVIVRKFSWDEDGEHSEYCLSVTMTNYQTFWGRLKMSFRYLFKLDNADHQYVDVIMEDSSIAKLKTFIKDYEESKNEQNA